MMNMMKVLDIENDTMLMILEGIETIRADMKNIDADLCLNPRFYTWEDLADIQRKITDAHWVVNNTVRLAKPYLRGSK